MIEKLSKELELTRTQHSEQVEQLNSQWEGRLKEAWEDYRRMKVSEHHCKTNMRELDSVFSMVLSVGYAFGYVKISL